MERNWPEKALMVPDLVLLNNPILYMKHLSEWIGFLFPFVFLSLQTLLSH